MEHSTVSPAAPAANALISPRTHAHTRVVLRPGASPSHHRLTVQALAVRLSMLATAWCRRPIQTDAQRATRVALG
eukprot:352672-Chlamydomonas_euryale.AAC.8